MGNLDLASLRIRHRRDPLSSQTSKPRSCRGARLRRRDFCGSFGSLVLWQPSRLCRAGCRCDSAEMERPEMLVMAHLLAEFGLRSNIVESTKAQSHIHCNSLFLYVFIMKFSFPLSTDQLSFSVSPYHRIIKSFTFLWP